MTMSVYNGAELTDEGARYWLCQDGWNEDEAAYLLHAIDPMRLNRWAQTVGGRLEVAFPEQFDALRAMIARAFEAGALHSPARPGDVIAWAKAKQLRLPRQFLDAQFGGTEQTAPAAGGTATTNRTAARIAAIVKTARHFGYDPLSVPYGGKAAIERECLDKLAADPCRFTPDTFKSAWQAARDARQIDVQDAEIYRGQ